MLRDVQSTDTSGDDIRKFLRRSVRMLKPRYRFGDHGDRLVEELSECFLVLLQDHTI